jgi:hypothetical protein
LVSRPKRKKQIDIKWIYKENKNVKGEAKRYKVKLVVKCNSKKHGIDNYHNYPYRWEIYQIEVKSTFLNGFLEEKVYIKQPIGYEVKGLKDNFKEEQGLLWIEVSPKSLV